MQGNRTTLDITHFAEPGLYLVFPTGEQIDLTRKRIESLTDAMLADPEALSPAVRAAADYQACDVCPERETAKICHAIMTTLPFLDEIDRYMSYDSVTAVFREASSELLHVRQTTMQEALQYVTTLSLIHYCEIGKQYACHFEGVNPLMLREEIAHTVFANMYVACEGDTVRLQEMLHQMREHIMHTTECQVKRLRAISKRDAFVNAFIGVATTTEYLIMEVASHIPSVACRPLQ